MIEINDWSRRVNLSMLAMILVETWMVFSSAMRYNPIIQLNEEEFYSVPAEELIDTSCDGERG